VSVIRAWLGVRNLVLPAVLALITSGVAVTVNAAPAYADFGAMHQPANGIVTSKIDNR